MSEMPKEVRAWVTREGLAHGFGSFGEAHDLRGVPVRILPYPPDDPPPEWERGQKVRMKYRPHRTETVFSDIYRNSRDEWCFQNAGNHAELCASFEPVPTTESVTLRFTGDPERIKRVREAGVWAPWNGLDTLTVEVVEDA